jgi:positive regulator of sigma E activity
LSACALCRSRARVGGEALQRLQGGCSSHTVGIEASGVALLIGLVVLLDNVILVEVVIDLGV